MALKKKVFVISVSVLLLIILIIGCIFALRPVCITESYMLTENFPSSENFEYRLGAISRQDDDDAQIFYLVDNYPSYDYGDYRVICIDFIYLLFRQELTVFRSAKKMMITLLCTKHRWSSSHSLTQTAKTIPQTA